MRTQKSKISIFFVLYSFIWVIQKYSVTFNSKGKVRRVSELDSLVDKLTLLLDNHSTSKNNPGNICINQNIFGVTFYKPACQSVGWFDYIVNMISLLERTSLASIRIKNKTKNVCLIFSLKGQLRLGLYEFAIICHIKKLYV